MSNGAKCNISRLEKDDIDLKGSHITSGWVTQQTPSIEPMPGRNRTDVVDGGPAPSQHRLNVPCRPGNPPAQHHPHDVHAWHLNSKTTTQNKHKINHNQSCKYYSFLSVNGMSLLNRYFFKRRLNVVIVQLMLILLSK